jgi:ABC-type polysaccharide/polyol phosphate transport system ATPase subunit
MYDQAMEPVPTPAPTDALVKDERELIVRAEGLGKSFKRWEHQPFLLRNLMLRLIGRAHKPKEFWPLRNISFDIRRGEAVGLIGQNGAGKSTLLRIIAGACFPSEGVLSVRGRIAPLLALGIGFQPDMTGYECVEINATTLGLTKEEIAERMQDIIDFADLKDFMDTPMRFYSSGMSARLGFAVAVHTSPDLLLVDEVLSVGDHSFQRKCQKRIDQMRTDGVTIVFVSHSTAVVKALCNRALWLKDGKLMEDGHPDRVCERYLLDMG